MSRIDLSFRALLVLTCLLCSGQVAGAEVLRRGLGAEPDSLDIHQAQGLSSIQVLRDLSEGLMTYDAHGELTGGAAASWEVSSDGRQYRFELREGASWSNGDPLLAADFIRSWQIALAPRTQARTATLLTPIHNAHRVMAGEADPVELGISADSQHVLKVRLEEPTPWFLELLAHPVSFPLHANRNADVARRPSNGAYRVAELLPRAYLRLEKNPHYHASATVQVDVVEYLPIEDAGSELARYRAGEIDITETIPPGRFEWLAGNFSEELRVAPYLGSFWLGINMRSRPLGDNADLRRALALAVDRDILVKVVLGAGELPAATVVPPGMAGYVPPSDPALKLDKAERERRAQALYARSGFGPDRPLRIQLRFNTSPQHRRLAVAVAAMWKQVLGAQAELIQEEWKVFVNNRRHGVLTEVFRGGWIADYADPTTFLDLFRSAVELNTTFYANPAYDRLLDRAAGLRGRQRMELLQQAETLLLRDMPLIPLYHYVSRHLVKPRVGGFHENPRDIHLSRHLFLKQEGR